jgi:hypothetical protein
LAPLCIIFFFRRTTARATERFPRRMGIDPAGGRMAPPPSVWIGSRSHPNASSERHPTTAALHAGALAPPPAGQWPMAGQRPHGSAQRHRMGWLVARLADASPTCCSRRNRPRQRKNEPSVGKFLQSGRPEQIRRDASSPSREPFGCRQAAAFEPVAEHAFGLPGQSPGRAPSRVHGSPRTGRGADYRLVFERLTSAASQRCLHSSQGCPAASAADRQRRS